MLADTWPKQGVWKRDQYPDLQRLLPAAQGAKLSWETAMDRRKPRSARDNVDDVVGVNQLEPASVIIVFLQQVEVFAKWRALQEANRPVGLSRP